MHQHEKMNYVEFTVTDLAASKRFFTRAFAWQFEDYGPEYSAFSGQGLDGGLCLGEDGEHQPVLQAGPLIVFYSDQLEATLVKVKAAGAVITKDIFTFPGGRRFQFVEPGGNQLAVWSE